jgi:hypothetical protein
MRVACEQLFTFQSDFVLALLMQMAEVGHTGTFSLLVSHDMSRKWKTCVTPFMVTRLVVQTAADFGLNFLKYKIISSDNSVFKGEKNLRFSSLIE